MKANTKAAITAVVAAVREINKAQSTETASLVKLGKTLPPCDRNAPELAEVRKALAAGYEKALGRVDRARVSSAMFIVYAASNGIVSELKAGVSAVAQDLRSVTFADYKPKSEPKSGPKSGPKSERHGASDRKPKTVDTAVVPRSKAFRVLLFLKLAEEFDITFTKTQIAAIERAKAEAEAEVKAKLKAEAEAK